MKVPQDLRSRLEKAAKKSGRNLTSEVGYRVERGFDYEKLFGSEYTQILIRLIADAITLIERNTGKRWNEDPRVLETALHAVRLIADTADLVGTDPDKRPDDHQLDALKKAVGKPAEAIVDLVTGDRELLAVTERDVFKDACRTRAPGAEAGAGKALTPLRYRPECLGHRPNGYLNTVPFSKCLYSATLRD